MVAMSVVNVTNYDDYVWTDRSAVAAFRANARKVRLASIETTHGLIRTLSGESAFFYVSGIANEQGSFDFDNVPRTYSQNLVASHNAGICVAFLLPELGPILH